MAIDWLYPGDWEYLMDYVFRYEDLYVCAERLSSLSNIFYSRDQHMAPHDGDAMSVYSLPSGWSNDDDPTWSSHASHSSISSPSSLPSLSDLSDLSDLSSLLSTISASTNADAVGSQACLSSTGGGGITVLHITSELQLDPQVPYGVTGVSPRLRPLLSVFKLADLYLFATARKQVIAAIRDHPDFLRLSPDDQLSLALKARVPAWLRAPFEKLVRSHQFRASDARDLPPDSAEVIHATRLNIKLEMYLSAYALANFNAPLILPRDQCGRRELSPAQSTWYVRTWSSIKQHIFRQRGDELGARKTCEQEFDCLMVHCVLLPIVRGASAMVVEASIQFYAARHFCSRCYDNLVAKVVVEQRFSKRQALVEADGLRDFKKSLGFPTPHRTA